MTQSDDLEVEVREEGGRAVVRGKTVVPFKTFVDLILKRKLQAIFKEWKDEPVIVSSELLGSLASAPDESREDRGALVLVTLLTGVFSGLFLAGVILLCLLLLEAVPTSLDIVVALGIFIAFALLVVLTQKFQKRPSAKQKITEGMERMTELFARK